MVFLYGEAPVGITQGMDGKCTENKFGLMLAMNALRKTEREKIKQNNF